MYTEVVINGNKVENPIVKALVILTSFIVVGGVVAFALAGVVFTTVLAVGLWIVLWMFMPVFILFMIGWLFLHFLRRP